LRAQHREALARQVQAIVAGGRTAGPPWGTGLTALDAALGGGIPRGRLTELTGPLAVGKTTLLRQVVARVLHTGSWVAWIDAGRTLAPAPWADLGERFVVIRLPEPRRAAWTADLLLRSGVFGLVVLDGAPPLSRGHGVRLAQVARERDAACVVLTHETPGLSRLSRLAGTVRVRIALAMPPSLQAQWTRGPHRHRRPLVVADGGAAPESSAAPPAPRVVVTVEKGGALNRNQSIEVDRVVVVARRVCADSEIPDRRGVARSARRPWAPSGNGVDTGDDTQRSEHPVTWGGLGVGSHDLYGTDLPGHPARLAAGLDEPGDRLGSDRFEDTDRLRLDRELDRRTRDWTTYRGRRRAAESGFGRRGRRELARERTGALLGSGGGQSAPRKERPDPAPAAAAAPPALG
jgi:hypothetical protein